MVSKRLVVLVVTLIVAIGLVGCGGSKEQAASPDVVAAGQTAFASACSACHGPDAKGVPNLGKDLTASTFTKGLSDADLIAFTKKGRPANDPQNTTKVDMPPKGGNPALTDDQLTAIVAYLRTLQK
jgi:disulfide bond formation protein DsbB